MTSQTDPSARGVKSDPVIPRPPPDEPSSVLGQPRRPRVPVHFVFGIVATCLAVALVELVLGASFLLGPGVSEPPETDPETVAMDNFFRRVGGAIGLAHSLALAAFCLVLLGWLRRRSRSTPAAGGIAAPRKTVLAWIVVGSVLLAPSGLVLTADFSELTSSKTSPPMRLPPPAWGQTLARYWVPTDFGIAQGGVEDSYSGGFFIMKVWGPALPVGQACAELRASLTVSWPERTFLPVANSTKIPGLSTGVAKACVFVSSLPKPSPTPSIAAQVFERAPTQWATIQVVVY